MNKFKSVIITAAIALPLAVFSVSAFAGQRSTINGEVGTSSMFSTGGHVMAHTYDNFTVGAHANRGAVVGANGYSSNATNAGHHYGRSNSAGNLSTYANTRRTSVNFNGGMDTSAYGNGRSNTTADVGFSAVANKNGHGTVATANMGTDGTAMSRGNVQSYTSSGGNVSAFAWH